MSNVGDDFWMFAHEQSPFPAPATVNQSAQVSSLACRRATLRRPRTVACLLALSLAAHLSPVSAQFKLQQTFMGTAAPGWTLSGNAFLTAPSLDASGQGWLRLTDAAGAERGLALDTSQNFAANVPVSIQISYVSWGGDRRGRRYHISLRFDAGHERGVQWRRPRLLQWRGRLPCHRAGRVREFLQPGRPLPQRGPRTGA